MIVTDDQRTDSLGAMPNVNRWIRDRGVWFPRAMVTTPLCCPSRASIFSGDYAHNTHVHGNASQAFRSLEQGATMQALLHKAGYQTGIVGKYFNDWPIGRAPPHFDRWAIFAPGDHGAGGYYDTIWNVNGRVVRPAVYSTSFVAERGLSFLHAFQHRGHTPWFLYLAPFAPHGPATPGPGCTSVAVPAMAPNPAMLETDRSDKPWWVQGEPHGFTTLEGFRVDQYRALCSVDRMVGQIMSTLVRLDEARNTLVVFMSDNGVLLGEHGLADKGYPYPPDLQVPLLLRWPGHIRPSSTDGRLAANIDIAPTILDAARVSPAPGHPMDGRSLLRRWDRRAFFAEWWATVNPGFPAPTWHALITRRYEYVEYVSKRRVVYREYYDLVRDPWELTNLFHDGVAGNEPNVKALHARLRALQHCSGRACW